MEINYHNIDAKYVDIILGIEKRPHVRYIRYLMTKRFSPTSIRTELQRVGLSSPHEDRLQIYFLNVMDPLIKKHGLGPLYADYKNKMTTKSTKGDYSKHILNYRLDVADDKALSVTFAKFIKAAEVDDLWLREIYNYHGAADRMPKDENGVGIINTTSASKSAEKILVHKKRYLVDKMILENVPDARIAKYFREEFDAKFNDYDVSAYKRSFFNIQTLEIEYQIQQLEAEEVSLTQLLEDLENGSEEYGTMGDRLLIKVQTEQRLEELSDNIKTLNAMYSNAAFNAASAEKQSFADMFEDVVRRGYRRYIDLDEATDRDVVNPLTSIARMMGHAFDKYALASTDGFGTGVTDQHSQAELIKLYAAREEEIHAQDLERINKELDKMGLEPMDRKINLDDVMGVDEIAASFDYSKEDEEE